MKTVTSHWRLLLPAFATVAVLTGCAGNMPKPDPSEAWVALHEEPTTTLMAEKIDGKRLNDGRFFEVPGGSHSLEASLYIEGIGDSNGSTCRADLSYDNFKPGGNYSLVETSLGQDYTVTLYSHSGKELAQTSATECMPG